MNDLLVRRALRGRRLFCARLCHTIHYNPFYLLSAMCMLAGLFALNDSLDWSPLPKHNLLWLILILSVYELLLIGLGAFLARRGLWRDAATLFVLEAFFLVDAGFLNAEIFAFDFSLGLAINVVLFLLAFIKLAVVFRSLGLPLSDLRYPLVLAQMLILLAMPGLFKGVFESSLRDLPIAIFGAWWVVGLIPILYLLMLREMPPERHRAIIATFILLPAVSILAHLCTSNWVYHVRWQSANLAPLFLGLAAAIGGSDRHVRSLALRMRLHLALPLLAILLTSSNPRPLYLHFGGDLLLTPTRLAVLVAAAVYLYGLLLHRHPYFGVAGALCLGAAGLGESPGAMANNLTLVSRTTAGTAWRFVPRTVAQWGITSIVASYLLLAIGMLLSLNRPIPKPVEADD